MTTPSICIVGGLLILFLLFLIVILIAMWINEQNNERGQAMAETAVIAPVLLLMFLGVIEVGFLVKDYMVILNVSREGARFASKPVYAIADNTSFLQTVDHIEDAMSPLEFEKSAAIATVIEVNTDYPCDPALRSESVEQADGHIDYWPNCDCDLAATSPYTPWLITSAVYSISNLSMATDSNIDVPLLSQQMAADNERINCVAVKTAKNAEPSQIHQMVIIEIFYLHKFIFWPVPYLIHTSTAMRMYQSRDDWKIEQ